MKELSIGTEKFMHTHRFSEDELNELKTKYSDDSIAIKTKEEELTALKESLAPRIKELKKSSALSLNDIRNGFRREERQCYLVPDYDAQTVSYTCVNTGEVLYTRKMLPQERQLPLHKVG